eukprot:TRINITY_DN35247_c0_g1_i1.p1 TRINITY_DN35247_c0_g1~~TRINITY_DN35247_c0_g1_i1.p1  ORF type:complete len:189 (-),score=12.25 TRINITY_DN35247_c0_g1_i1:215-781(-)
MVITNWRPAPWKVYEQIIAGRLGLQPTTGKCSPCVVAECDRSCPDMVMDHHGHAVVVDAKYYHGTNVSKHDIAKLFRDMLERKARWGVLIHHKAQVSANIKRYAAALNIALVHSVSQCDLETAVHNSLEAITNERNPSTRAINNAATYFLPGLQEWRLNVEHVRTHLNEWQPPAAARRQRRAIYRKRN